MKIFNQTKNIIISAQATVAKSFWQRTVGLIGRKFLSSSESLIIPSCQSIHMCFMKFPIDVIFVDKENKVVGLVENIKPYQLSPIFFNASYAIEGAAGVVQLTKTQLGDIIQLET